jgi:hypothetical protein
VDTGAGGGGGGGEKREEKMGLMEKVLESLVTMFRTY